MHDSLSYFRTCYDVAEKDKRNFAFISHFNAYYSALGVVLIVDSCLNILDTVNIPDDLYEGFSPKLVDDSIFIICTGKLDSDYIYISKIKETGHIIKSRSFGKNNSLAGPSYQNSLAISNDNIYFLVNVDFCLANPFLGLGVPSSIMIGKLDSDLNTKWLQFHGGDYYYHAYNIKATSDGGCILIGTLNDTINHNNNRNIFIVKLDSNGSSTWSRNIKISEPNVNVFPNPVSDYLNISIAIAAFNERISEITIFNIQGNEILHKQVNENSTKINMSRLKKGIYVLEGVTGTGKYFRRKIIKE